MKSYGYFYILNHIALAVDKSSRVDGFKELVELDMFNRASIFVLPDAEPRARQIIRDLSDSLYPKSDMNPSVEQRMMLVQTLLDQEIDKIVGTMRFFVPFAYTKEDLIEKFGFFEQGGGLNIPYYLRHMFLDEQAVFLKGELTSFAKAVSEGQLSKTDMQYGLFPAQAFGKNDIPEKYKHLPLF